jgi:hypothetical protein
MGAVKRPHGWGVKHARLRHKTMALRCGITLEEDPEKGPNNIGEGENWHLLVSLIQAIWTQGKILQQLTWVIVVLLLKGGGDYRGISLLELLWKVVE